jgi:hypothetical protein
MSVRRRLAAPEELASALAVYSNAIALVPALEFRTEYTLPGIVGAFCQYRGRKYCVEAQDTVPLQCEEYSYSNLSSQVRQSLPR